MRSNLTPLARRLTEAAAIGMAGESEADDHLRGWTGRGLSGDASAAVVAVLRELADEHTSRDGNWLAIPPPMLIGLADSIEKGEG